MREPRRPAELRGKVFRRPAAKSTNALLTNDELRSRAWHRLHRGAYADSALPLSHGLRAAAAHLVMPASAAVGGASAAWFYGVELVDVNDPIEVIVPPDDRFGRVKGLRIRRTALPTADVIAGRPAITTPDRTAWDIARFQPLPDALALLDALVAQRVIDRPALQRRLRDADVRWGRRRAAIAIDHIDGRSESPQESRLRGHLALAGLPRPEVQHVVHHRGRRIGRVDLAWPMQRVAVEYDGIWHADAAQLHRDRRRLNGLVTAGWRVIHVTSVRLKSDLPAVIAEIRAALEG